MPNNKNERKGKQAGELSSEERFRNFFSTSVIDLPEEMTRRDEPAPVEEKPKAGLLGKLFGHDKEETAAPAQPVLEIPTGEILLGADAKPVQPELLRQKLRRKHPCRQRLFHPGHRCGAGRAGVRHPVPPGKERRHRAADPQGVQRIVSGLALSVIAAQCHLSQRERPWQYGKVSGFAKGSPFGGAVTEGD